jgi:hypothetical protein
MQKQLTVLQTIMLSKSYLTIVFDLGLKRVLSGLLWRPTNDSVRLVAHSNFHTL